MVVTACATLLGAMPAFAADAPSCVAQLKKDYGSTDALNADCPSESDCTFMAPTGNASARALIETIAGKVESCFTGAELKMTKEDKVAEGTTRIFEAADVKCALLTSAPNGTPPEGVRAVCQPK